MFDLKSNKNNIALYDDLGRILTYNRLNEICEEVSKIINRSLCFILCDNSIGSIIGYISCLNNRVVPLLLNAGIDNKLLKNLLDIYRPQYLWKPKSLKLSNIDYIDACKHLYDTFSYELTECLYHDKDLIIHDDLALLLTTSGSTGSPKFVKQSYKNIKSNARSIIEYLELNEKEKPITTLPMNYTYGLSIINSHLMVGATIYVTGATIAQKEFWNFFKENKITSIAGVPYNYEILDKLRFTKMDLPYLKTMTQAGGKLSIELHEKFARYAEDTHKKFVVMYGQCEATARMGYLPAEKALDKIGSMGIAIPGGKFTLIDVEGNVIDKPEIVGELVYEGDNVTLGYAESREDLAKGDERFGKLITGDMAKFDSDGYFYIVGRKKRFLKVYGNRVNLDELERLAKSKFGVEDIVVAGVDDNVTIFCLDSKTGDDIRTYLSGITKLNPKSFNVKIINAIPHNDSGKVLYNELNRLI